MIAKITKAYVRRYSDNGQTTAYVEWLDQKGKTGRTEGPATIEGDRYKVGLHMEMLLARAEREGHHVTFELW